MIDVLVFEMLTHSVQVLQMHCVFEQRVLPPCDRLQLLLAVIALQIHLLHLFMLTISVSHRFNVLSASLATHF